MPQPHCAAEAPAHTSGLARCALRRADRSPLEAGATCAGHASSVTLLRALATRGGSCGSCAQECLPASPCGSAHALPYASRGQREPGPSCPPDMPSDPVDARLPPEASRGPPAPKADPADAACDPRSPSGPGRAPCAKGRASRGGRESGLSAGCRAPLGVNYALVRLLLLLLPALPSLAKGRLRRGALSIRATSSPPLALPSSSFRFLLPLFLFVFLFLFFFPSF